MPQIFKAVIIPLIRGEDVQNNIPKIHEHPPVFGQALQPAFVMVAGLNIVPHSISQCVYSPAGISGANYEIICKSSQIPNIHQDDIFPLFIFQNIDDIASECKCIQQHLFLWID